MCDGVNYDSKALVWLPGCEPTKLSNHSNPSPGPRYIMPSNRRALLHQQVLTATTYFLHFIGIAATLYLPTSQLLATTLSHISSFWRSLGQQVDSWTSGPYFQWARDATTCVHVFLCPPPAYLWLHDIPQWCQSWRTGSNFSICLCHRAFSPAPRGEVSAFKWDNFKVCTISSHVTLSLTWTIRYFKKVLVAVSEGNFDNFHVKLPDPTLVSDDIHNNSKFYLFLPMCWELLMAPTLTHGQQLLIAT